MNAFQVGLFLRLPCKITKSSKTLFFYGFLKGFGGPRGSQNAPKSLQNRSQRPFGASWGSLGAILASLGASWAALGASWGSLGALLAPLAALLAALRALLRSLGQLLGPLGPLLAALGVVLGGSWGPFWFPGGLFLELIGSLFAAPLHNHENIKKQRFSRCFLLFLEVPGDPRTLQNRSKIALGASWCPMGLSWGSLGALLGLSWPLWAPLGQLLAPLGPPPEGPGLF